MNQRLRKRKPQDNDQDEMTGVKTMPGVERPFRALPGAFASVMPKLTVGAVSDPCEADADRLADLVLQMTEPTALDSGGASRVPAIRRSSDALGSFQAPPIVDEVVSSPGSPLPENVRSYMEPRFGHRFADVSIHTDARAAESADGIQARAYTVGNDLVFGEGQFNPGTSNGKWLLAHELAHVVQGGGATGTANRLQAEPIVERSSASGSASSSDQLQAVPLVPDGGTPLNHPARAVAAPAQLSDIDIDLAEQYAGQIREELKSTFPNQSMLSGLLVATYNRDYAEFNGQGGDPWPRTDLLFRKLQQHTYETGMVVKQTTSYLDGLLSAVGVEDVRPVFANSRLFKNYKPVEGPSYLTGLAIDAPIAATGALAGAVSATIFAAGVLGLPLTEEAGVFASDWFDGVATEYAKSTGANMDVYKWEKVAGFAAVVEIAGAEILEGYTAIKSATAILAGPKTIAVFKKLRACYALGNAFGYFLLLLESGKSASEIYTDPILMKKVAEAVENSISGGALVRVSEDIQFAAECFSKAASAYGILALVQEHKELEELKDQTPEVDHKKKVTVLEVKLEIVKLLVDFAKVAVSKE